MASPTSAGLESSPWYRFLRGGIRLRVGVLSDAAGIPRWQAAALELAAALPEIAIEDLFVLPERADAGAPPPWLFRKLLSWSQAGADDPFAPVLTALRGAQRHELRGDEGHGLAPQDREWIAARQLDVLFCATARPVTGDCTKLARQGVWSFFPGEPEFHAYRPPYWREAYQDRSVSRIFLLMHEQRFERGRAIQELATGTVSRLRFTLNQTAPLEAAGGLLGRSLLQPSELVSRKAGAEYSAALSQRWPTNFETATFAARKLTQSATYRMRLRGRAMTWFVAIRAAGGGTDLENPAAGGPFREIAAPPGHWYADPFLAERDSRHWLFVEDWVESNGRGCLSCMEVRNDGSLGDPMVVLDRPYHLSYPHVFSHGGEFFLIPESQENATVQLYRATRFPDEWKLEAILMDNIELVDTTAWLYEGTWYFFASSLRQPEEAYVFTSSRIDGPWQYHPANPICSDTRRLRGGGAVFSQRGRTIRPAQDCSVGYGYAVAFNEIRRLSPRDYEERQAGAMLPDWLRGLTGTHTYNFDSRYEVVDGFKPMKPAL